MTTPYMGWQGQLGMGTIVTITEAYEFKSESLASERTVIKTAGMRGTRAQVFERVRQGTLAPGGSIVLEPTHAELINLLPRILGGAVIAKTVLLADTLPNFWVMVDRGAKVYTYNSCVCDKGIFRGSEGQFLELQMDVEGLTETIGAAGSFTGGLTIDANPPWTFFDGVLTLNSVALPIFDFELTVDNMLKKDRFVNGQTRAFLMPMDRVVTLKITTPYSVAGSAFYDGVGASISGTLVFTNGAVTLTFTLEDTWFPAKKSPVLTRKDDEIKMTLEGQVFSTAGGSELTVSYS